MRKLPLQQSTIAPTTDGAYQAAPRPFVLWRCSDALLGVHAIAGRYMAYEGACMAAALLDLDGYVRHEPYELRPEYKVPGRPHAGRSWADTRDELRELCRQVMAVRARLDADAPRFADTSCSQCGASLGPGDAGVSHCSNH